MNVVQEQTILKEAQEDRDAPAARRGAGPGTAAGLAGNERVPALAAGLLLLALARPVLLSWLGQYLRPESYYAHAPLIPVIIGLMLWYRRDALRAAPRRPCLGALVVLVPALGLFEFAAHNHAMALQSLAFLFVLWGSVWLVLGTRFWKAAAFPLLFVAFMAPCRVPSSTTPRCLSSTSPPSWRTRCCT